jgi:hypothetical protein
MLLAQPSIETCTDRIKAAVARQIGSNEPGSGLAYARKSTQWMER